MDFLQSLLPPAKGILPYYMLVLSLISVGNSFQNLKTMHYSRRLYDGRFIRNPKLGPATPTFNPEDSVHKLVPAHEDPRAADQLTPLGARLFGTWTLLTSIVRCYAAYHLHSQPWYDLAMWTYVVALGHYASELFIFKSMTFGLPQYFPFTLATVALIWMPMVRSFYIEG
ncbi:Ergosterol biosynthetic protein 28 [Escovopsis weberi]|uniref:Ergosterol biosynthetic protein 28 n=1 Tax=Escovopsis weberi TaxID=150374 RepID=A0A0M8MX40_ESCWE|nr:Ergosterol biosynthetic protein 28 [Escovopsis weberi]